MSKYVSVLPFNCQSSINPSILKRNLLFYDIIVVTLPLIGEKTVFSIGPGYNNYRALSKAKLMTTVDPEEMSKGNPQNTKLLKNYKKHLKAITEKEFDFLEYYGSLARYDSILLQNLNINAYPMLPTTQFNKISDDSKKSEVIQVVLKNLPLPNEDTTLERIIDFRSNISENDLLALKNWINDIKNSELSIKEIEEKIEYLLNEFRRYMEIHKIKYEMGIFETVIKATAEIIENAAKFKFGKLADTLFSFTKKEIQLMEAELKAPGKELSYIIKAENEFK